MILAQVVSEGFSLEPALLHLLRWGHLASGVLWLGALFFYALILGHVDRATPPEQKKLLASELHARAMGWIRWGAMVTLLSGWGYLLWQELGIRAGGFKGWLSFGPGGSGASNAWILFGGVLGTVMWAHVWFVIWPVYQTALSVSAGKLPAPQDLPRLLAKARRMSLANAYLSLPVLFAMSARGHFPVARSGLEALGWMAAVLLLGAGVAHVCITVVAPRMGHEFRA